jgi:hypothetical protein
MYSHGTSMQKTNHKKPLHHLVLETVLSVAGLLIIPIGISLPSTFHHAHTQVSVAPNPVTLTQKIVTPDPPAPSPIPHPASRPSLAHSTPIQPKPRLASSIQYPGLPNYPHTQIKYSSLTLPSGPLYTREGFLDKIAASAGFDAASAVSQHTPVTVAVIDTGFALNHENLVGRWAVNSAESGAASTDGIDNDHDGYIDNFRGWDFVHNTNNPQAGLDNPGGSGVTHGTLTAGLASLLNPSDKILPLQALDDNGSGYTDDVSAAVRYAADHGARIISLSLGSSSPDDYLHQQISYAVSKGVIVVAAAGNNGCNCMLYPAAYPEVLAVGATSATDVPADFSSYGPNLAILAPGTAGDVCSSEYAAQDPTTSYTCNYSGTSLATPIVSGLVALLVQQCPTCSPAIITGSLLAGADRLPGMQSSARTDTTGYGRINVLGAVNALANAPSNLSANNPLQGDLNGDGRVDSADLGILTSQWHTAATGPDLNGDGIVDIYDFSILLSHWTG